MAKLINILAASVGGGLMLGVGIRLVEAVSAREVEPTIPLGGRLATRLESLEDRLVRMEGGAPASGAVPAEVTRLHLRLDRQQREIEGIREQLGAADSSISRLDGQTERLRSELGEWVDTSLGERLADIEAKLQASIETGQRDTLDALVEGVQSRVVLRISKLEEEVAGQSAGMADLRERALQNERSMQKLLQGIDRLVLAQNRPAAPFEPPPEPRPELVRSPESTTPEPARAAPVFEEKQRARRWGLFS